MRIITLRTLKNFWEENIDAEKSLKSWYAEVKVASWQTPTEITAKYRSASILKNSRVVFNICGNKYRLVVRINYKYSVVYIRFIGTHRQYDQTNVEEI